MIADLYLLEVSEHQLQILRASFIRDRIDTEQSIAESSKRLAWARERNDATLAEMAEESLRTNHARLLALESVRPLLYQVRSRAEHRSDKSIARLSRTRRR